MRSSTASGSLYVYGVVGSQFALPTLPLGVDDTILDIIWHDDVGALVSTLDHDTYAPHVIEHNAANVDWLEPRAVAHDRVVTWASDQGAIVPLPMWTIFSDADGVREILRAHHADLRATLDRVTDAREYTVRVYAHLETVAAHAASLSPHIAELERTAASASPGQAYLLTRKLAEARKTEIRTISRTVADATYDALAVHASDAVRDPLPTTQGEGNAILNASFLVTNATYDAFREALTVLITQYDPTGFRFDFTGPWPPYHFVRAA